MASINHWAEIQNGEREQEMHAWFSCSPGSFPKCCREHFFQTKGMAKTVGFDPFLQGKKFEKG